MFDKFADWVPPGRDGENWRLSTVIDDREDLRDPLLPKGHDEGTLLCSVRPVSSINAYLEIMLNFFQVLDREPNCSDCLNETLLTGVNYGQPETKGLLRRLQVAVTQLSICGLVEFGSSIKRQVSYRFKPEGLDLAQRPGDLPDSYRQLKSGHTES